jgi:YggT family protein
MPSDLAGLVNLLFNLLALAIIARALLSFIDPGLRSSVGRFLFDVTEPVLAPIRQVVPSLGMIDLSPLIALLLLRVLQQLIVTAIA